MDSISNSKPTVEAVTEAMDIATDDWRTAIQSDYRKRVVDRIMGILKKKVQSSNGDGLVEIATRFEEQMYSSATSQVDYRGKIGMTLSAMEIESQTMQSNSAGTGTGTDIGTAQNPSVPDPPPVPASQNMQPQVPNQGLSQIPLPNQSQQQPIQSQQQLLQSQHQLLPQSPARSFVSGSNLIQGRQPFTLSQQQLLNKQMTLPPPFVHLYGASQMPLIHQQNGAASNPPITTSKATSPMSQPLMIPQLMNPQLQLQNRQLALQQQLQIQLSALHKQLQQLALQQQPGQITTKATSPMEMFQQQMIPQFQQQLQQLEALQQQFAQFPKVHLNGGANNLTLQLSQQRIMIEQLQQQFHQLALQQQPHQLPAASQMPLVHQQNGGASNLPIITNEVKSAIVMSQQHSSSDEQIHDQLQTQEEKKQVPLLPKTITPPLQSAKSASTNFVTASSLSMPLLNIDPEKQSLDTKSSVFTTQDLALVLGWIIVFYFCAVFIFRNLLIFF